MFRLTLGRPSVFLVGGDTGGYLQKLSSGFRSLGLRAPIFTVPNRVGYRTSAGPHPLRLLLPLNQILRFGLIQKVVRATGMLLITLIISVVGKRGDLMVVSSPNLKYRVLLVIAKRRGIFIISVFHGSDIRPTYLNGILIRELSLDEVQASTRRQAETTQAIETLSDAVISWAMIGHFLTRPYYEMENVGFPNQGPFATATTHVCQTSAVRDRPIFPEQRASPLKIIHSPSNPPAKGTEEILETVAQLEKQGISIELEVIQGASNRVVRERLRRADLVLDQIYSDSAPSVLAMEGLESGVPVLMAGWSIAHDSYANRFSPGLTICHTDKFASTLIAMATSIDRQRNAEECPACGNLPSAKFDIALWSSEAVAKNLLAIRDQEIEENVEGIAKIALTSAEALGACATETTIRDTVRALIANYGSDALGVNHNVKLKASLENFAKTGP